MTLVVPFAPGASVDLLSRLLAREVSRTSGDTIVVENRPGANGIIGAEFVKNAAPDGKTLYVANVGSHAINTSLYGTRLPYDALRDFSPISLLWRFPSVLAVPADSPAHTVAELVALARHRAGGVTYASAGSGSGGHLLGEMLRAQSAAQFIHVPYKGAAPAVIDLLAGRVDCFFVSYSSIQKQVERGQLRILAVAGDNRLAVLPQVPTLQEAGFDQVSLQNWFGLVAPARTSVPELRRIHCLFTSALAQPEVVRQMAEQGVEAASSTPAELNALMRRDIQRLGDVVRAVGAAVE
ncbi:tripartite tricarboxylate transporter substrate binding protein [Diaphorobacter ruginosibacter]|uniref:Bug family tripartite tricarboxylate transporter substrate binding protein n=1 Tax=Diaphorobacter ruginosibacter TaxID=1715720 RepID=UPI0033415E66